MEDADDAMSAQFGIDFRVLGYLNFSSQNVARPICTILAEFDAESNEDGAADVSIGYINQAMTGNSFGCAGGNAVVVKWHGFQNIWETSQHEFSHLYGAPDRYPDPNNQHVNDVMEDHYNFADFWCVQAGKNDRGIVNGNSGKYD
jgi:hypothetical protein